ncbi:MAG: ATP-binding cassette domain-containing protein [Gammaproteobacteria bacterium]|nr:ATP-binding cassette domain-containing protein [Gammaproteobacteria bacterium]
MSADTLIALKSVSRVFGHGDGFVRALDDVSLHIESGEFVCITGPSGCGKSTLINLLGCLDRPTHGTYLLAGTDVARLDSDQRAAIRRREVGLVFQHYNLLDRRTALANVELPATYLAMDAKRRREKAVRLLDCLGLGGREDHVPAKLSGGEQQRVGLARALMADARVILADEPTAALDSQQQALLMGVFSNLARRGYTVVVASHDAAVAAAASRRIEIRDGRIVEDSGTRRDSTAEVLRQEPRLPGVGPWPSLGAAVREAFGSLRNAPMRSAFGILGIALGIGCATTLLSLAEGAYVRSKEFIGDLGADRISVSGISVSLTVDDAQAILREVGNVRETVPRMHGRFDVQYGDRREVVELVADRTEALPEFMYERYALERGAFLTHHDHDAGEQVVVVDHKLRESLFRPGEDPVGEIVLVDGLPFVVKGVLAPHTIRQGPMYASSPIREARHAFVPFRTARDQLLPKDARVSIDVYMTDSALVHDAANEIRDLLFRRHGRGGVSLAVHQDLLGAQEDLHRQNYVVLGGIGAVALLACGLGILATLLAGVSRQTREIGVRMAVGARRRDILGQFLAESGLIAMVGGVLGVLLALGAGPVVGRALDMPVAFAPWFVPATVLVALSVGVLAGILPAVRAASLDPVRALATD